MNNKISVKACYYKSVVKQHNRKIRLTSFFFLCVCLCVCVFFIFNFFLGGGVWVGGGGALGGACFLPLLG